MNAASGASGFATNEPEGPLCELGDSSHVLLTLLAPKADTVDRDPQVLIHRGHFLHYRVVKLTIGHEVDGIWPRLHFEDDFKAGRWVRPAAGLQLRDKVLDVLLARVGC